MANEAWVPEEHPDDGGGVGPRPACADECGEDGEVLEAALDKVAAGAPVGRRRNNLSQDERNVRVCDNLHLVAPIVRKFRETGANFEDLVQVGYVGLIKAVDSFNESFNVKFSTYATHLVAGEIRHYLRDRVDTVKKPRWLSALSRKMAIFIDRFLQEHQRLPTLGEIAQGINVSEEGVVEILKARSLATPAPLEEMNEETIAVEKIRSLHYETLRLPIEDSIALSQTIEALRALEQKVVYLFFYMDLNQTEIAKMMGLSQKKVSRVLHRGLDRMREILGKDVW